ncbi:MAG: hypothetical protein HOH36_15910 [Acidimicrobiaceae bacterium]|nr:hypothetical protein [Acidimicrobiaceae bacterium]
MNIDDDRLSAYLDDELASAERDEVEIALASDSALRSLLAELAEMKAVLGDSMIEPSSASIDRMIGAIERVDEQRSPTLSPVVDLASHRRVPTFAAVAGSIVIIASVVGGVGETASIPAIGDLIVRHEAAASDLESGVELAMDDDAMHEMMDDGPSIPIRLDLTYVDQDGPLLHAVFESPEGLMLSLFRQDGDADLNEIGNELGIGEIVDMGGHEMWASDMGETHIAVIDGDGFTWTIVGDAEADHMMTIMSDLPARSPSIGERIGDVADTIVNPFRLGI